MFNRTGVRILGWVGSGDSVLGLDPKGGGVSSGSHVYLDGLTYFVNDGKNYKTKQKFPTFPVVVGAKEKRN